MGIGGIHGSAVPSFDVPTRRVSNEMVGSSTDANGRLALLRPVDAADASQDLVLKGIHQGGAQDVFAVDVAQAFGIDDMFLPTVWSEAERGAVMPRFPGRTLEDLRMGTSAGLQQAIESATAVHAPGLSAAELTRAARTRRELVAAFNVVIANGDQHGLNIMFDAASSKLAFIDHALMNRYPLAADGLPTVRAAFMGSGIATRAGSTYELALGGDALTALQQVDRPAIGAAFDRLLERTAGVTALGRHSRELGPSFLGELFGRLDNVLATGLLRYHVV